MYCVLSFENELLRFNKINSRIAHRYVPLYNIYYNLNLMDLIIYTFVKSCLHNISCDHCFYQYSRYFVVFF